MDFSQDLFADGMSDGHSVDQLTPVDISEDITEIVVQSGPLEASENIAETVVSSSSVENLHSQDVIAVAPRVVQHMVETVLQQAEVVVQSPPADDFQDTADTVASSSPVENLHFQDASAVARQIVHDIVDAVVQQHAPDMVSAFLADDEDDDILSQAAMSTESRFTNSLNSLKQNLALQAASLKIKLQSSEALLLQLQEEKLCRQNTCSLANSLFDAHDATSSTDLHLFADFQSVYRSINSTSKPNAWYFNIHANAYLLAMKSFAAERESTPRFQRDSASSVVAIDNKITRLTSNIHSIKSEVEVVNIFKRQIDNL